MCALCGLLGDGTSWSDALSIEDQRATRMHRFRQVQILNTLLEPQRVRIRNLGDGSMMVTGPSGKNVVLRSFAGFWEALSQIGVAMPDPLDADLWAFDA